jgi:hypothetical protein
MNMTHLNAPSDPHGEMLRVCRPSGCVVVSDMHPAMMLRGMQARFHDPTSGQEVRPASHAHQLSDYVMAATRAGCVFDHLSEQIVSEDLACRFERARRCHSSFATTMKRSTSLSASWASCWSKIRPSRSKQSAGWSSRPRARLRLVCCWQGHQLQSRRHALARKRVVEYSCSSTRTTSEETTSITRRKVLSSFASRRTSRMARSPCSKTCMATSGISCNLAPQHRTHHDTA